MTDVFGRINDKTRLFDELLIISTNGGAGLLATASEALHEEAIKLL